VRKPKAVVATKTRPSSRPPVKATAPAPTPEAQAPADQHPGAPGPTTESSTGGPGQASPDDADDT
jgi:hypothetical protein